jgi:hypothetical protein
MDEDEIMELPRESVENIINDMLNEQGIIEIAGFRFTPAQIVRKLDEPGYRQMVNDWADRNAVEIV